MKVKEPFLRERFAKKADKKAGQFVASIGFDWRLYKEDIAGSIAHAEMLAECGIIPKAASKKIISGLASIKDEIENHSFQFDFSLEDIHMNIEHRLFEKIGDLAAWLHTARSRNDQISLDMRLYLKNEINNIITKLKEVQKSLLSLAKSNMELIMPGYTHLQHAQPVLMSHYFMAYFEMLQRDVQRLQDCYKRVDVLPLGSGALAGVPYPIDRHLLAQKLQFSYISENSIDAVSDRDFIIEFESTAAISMMHLSRLTEEFILWSTSEFNFIELDDAYCSSSSIMPQKKNPDILELMRGKTGRVFGNLMAILTIMKALPLSYNRDMQEDKVTLFDTVEIWSASLILIKEILQSLKINAREIYASLERGYILATDIADYLVKKGIPFRKAHSIVGRLVRYATKHKKSFHQISLQEYKKFSPLFTREVFKITLKYSVNNRDHYGGTSANQVKKAVQRAEALFNI